MMTMKVCVWDSTNKMLKLGRWFDDNDEGVGTILAEIITVTNRK